MKALNTLKSAYHTLMARITMLAIAATAFLLGAPAARAIDRTDLTNDTSGGQTASDVLTNLDNTAQEGATFIISLVSIGGFVVVAISLYTLWKASKEDREAKPVGALVGLVIGGLMAGVGTVMWIMRNTVI